MLGVYCGLLAGAVAMAALVCIAVSYEVAGAVIACVEVLREMGFPWLGVGLRREGARVRCLEDIANHVRDVLYKHRRSLRSWRSLQGRGRGLRQIIVACKRSTVNEREASNDLIRV
jgi:hypothetical protein